MHDIFNMRLLHLCSYILSDLSINGITSLGCIMLRLLEGRAAEVTETCTPIMVIDIYGIKEINLKSMVGFLPQ